MSCTYCLLGRYEDGIHVLIAGWWNTAHQNDTGYRKRERREEKKEKEEEREEGKGREESSQGIVRPTFESFAGSLGREFIYYDVL